ncbi:MAG: hypothetical protein Q9186_000357 [Xanthomendoza sp. 1 TL-2023]
MAEMHVEQIETKLSAALEDQDFDSSKTETLLQEYRIFCEHLILEKFHDALSKNLEAKLWDAHLRINGRFRKQLAYFLGIKGKKKSVEQRKAAKLYLTFLKSAQRFYRGYIQKLASLPGAIREITAIARSLSLDTTSSIPEADSQTSPERQHALLQSCHQTLIRLGDLSRYRESCWNNKARKKKWGPAIGYYDLAIAVDPFSGLPYNQLGIIYRTEDNPIRTLYYLYRALSAHEPPPTAFDNLCLEFKRIQEKAWEPNGLVDAPSLTEDPLTHMQCWFPLLHSLCFSGTATQEYDRLEGKILEQLCIGLNERSLDADFVCMVVLSNIAADFAAGDRWQDDPDEERKEHAFKSFQRLNIRTFSALLQSLKNERQQAMSEGNADKTDCITSSLRRLLPGLRYYSSWLISRVTLLSLHQDDTTLDRFVKEFWTVYAEALSLLIPTIRFETVPRIEYLLEEDEAILGFRPLQQGQMEQKYTISNSTTRKPKCHEVGVERLNPDTEMLCRIRDFLEDALELTRNDDIPIYFVQEKNCFVEKGAGHTSTPSGGAHHFVSVSAEGTSMMPPNPSLQIDPTDDTTSPDVPASVPSSIANIHGKVDDDLVAEPSNQSAPPPSLSSVTGNPPAQGKSVNETSYGISDSTLNALNQGHDEGARKGQQPSPSHIDSQHNKASSPPQQLLCHEDITSSSSSGRISDPTQQSQGPSQQHLPWHHHPARRIMASRYNQRHGGGNRFDEFEFHSSSILPGSSDFVRWSNNNNNDVAEATPPNGQG